MKLQILSFSLLLASLSVAHAGSDLWQPVTTQQKGIGDVIAADKQLFRVDAAQLKQLLLRAGMEGGAKSGSEIVLPVEAGEMQRFTLVESPIMAPKLAARYPDIRTYKIHGIDDPYASGRLSIGPKGFHAMITGPAASHYIDPQANDVYSVFSRKPDSTATPFNCGVTGHDHATPAGRLLAHTARRSAGNLQVYRLAVAGTAEYVDAVGNSIAAAQAEIVVAINRVNQIYERDLGIRLQIVAGNDALLYQDGVTDPYTNSDGSAMLSQNQSNIDSVIGSANYDIGHVFSTGGGGIASVGSVCDANFKAQGVTGLPSPRGEDFYIDFVAHEIGHQFNADHSFNGTTESCAGGRVPSSSFEPGSGSTIMSYAGICGEENITLDTNAMFGAGSINQIDAFTTSGFGNSCFTTLAITNPNEPVANAGSDFSIPHRTPFVLNATASDPDNDPLTYSWDQMDTGTATTNVTLGFDLGDNSLFRSYLPRTQNYRHFPALGTTLQNQFDDSEALACRTRTLNFRLTVRDGKSGIAQDDVTISVDNNSGPFAITAFNSAQTLTPGSYTLTWDVASTNLPPVSCAQVDISLLTFNASKTTYFETVLASSVDNDGSAAISVPSFSSSRARFKIQCSNNVFYDISDADLSIPASTPFATSGNTVFYNNGGRVTFPSPAETCVAGTGGSGGTGGTGGTTTSSGSSGSLDHYWLWLLLVSALGLRFRERLLLARCARYRVCSGIL